MKIHPLLTIGLPAFLAFSPARGWQNNQPADLALGSEHPGRVAFGNCEAAVTDPLTGKLFVGVYGRVLRFGSKAKLVNGAPAEAVLGKPEFIFTAYNGTASSTNLQGAFSLAMDAHGRLWVADAHRILRFDAASTKPSGAPADGVLGAADFTSLYPDGDPQRLGSSMKLALDGAGNLYASQSDRNRVLRFDAAAEKANGAAADAVFGQSSFTGSTPGLSPSRYSGPRSLAMHGTSLYIHDWGNRRVLRLDNAATRASGAAADAVIGQESPFVSSDGTLYVEAIAITPGGTLLVSKNLAITAWANAGALSGLLPAPLYQTGTMNAGSCLAVEGETRLWAGGGSGFGLNRMENLPAVQTPASTLGLASPPEIDHAWQVAVDPVSGKVFVSDQDAHRVLRYASQTMLASHQPPEAFFGTTTSATATGLYGPLGICVDGGGRLWVADPGHNRVLRFNDAASKPSGAAADGVIGQPNFTTGSSSGPPNEVTLRHPYGVSVDAGGTLWVADWLTARVVRYDHAATKSGHVPADGILGKADYSDVSTSSQPGRFLDVRHLQIDHAGRLWVLDTGRVSGLPFTIRLFRYDNANSKAAGAMPDETILLPNQNEVVTSGFSVNVDGVLWLAESGPFGARPRVLRYDNAAAVTSASTPDGHLGGGSLGIDAGRFAGNLNALHSDPAGNLWVSDVGNLRVLRFSKTPGTQLPAPGSVVAADRDVSGTLWLHYGAVPAGIYWMETTVDLIQWAPVGKPKIAVTPLEALVDPAPQGQKRFYRARRLD